MSTQRAVLRDRDGLVVASYQPAFLRRPDADLLLSALVERRSEFKSGFMVVGDVWVKSPRLVAEFGDDSHVYPDTGPNRRWLPQVRDLRDAAEQRLGQRFNYAIVNWYRNGRDFTGWHTDKMSLHAPGSAIAMVSVGVTRRFEFRETETGRLASATEVEHASLLMMRAGSQQGFEHSLRPDPSVDDIRISITLRNVLPTPEAERECPACAGRASATSREADDGSR